MGARFIGAGALLGLLCMQGCASPYGDTEATVQDVAASSAIARKSCATVETQVRDDFERSRATAAGWTKGRVSDGLPTITTVPTATKTTAVLTSKVAAATDDDAKATAFVEREIRTSGCFGAELDVSYSEEAPFPDDAWTYFFWFDASEGLNVSLFRRGSYVRLAAQRGGAELDRIDVELPPNQWTKIKVEIDLDPERPVMSIAVGKNAPRTATLTEPLVAPYFVSLGTWSRGRVPAHEFLFDNVKLRY